MSDAAADRARHLTRRRLGVAGLVLAVVAAIAVLGAVSKPSPTAASAGSSAAGVPSASWYWTMAVAPANANVLVLGTSDGLFRSSDGGKTWAATGPKDVSATSVVSDGSRLLMGGVRATPAESPIVHVGAGRTVAAGVAVLDASSDAGETWHPLHPSGLPTTALQALAVDPTNPEVVYALLQTGRLYRSSDGAKSFQLAAGKVEQTPWALAVTRGNHFVAGDMDTGSYVSSNGAAWQQTAFRNSAGGKMVMEYAVDPADPTRVLMSAFGVELSANGGTSWHEVLKTPVMFGPVAWASQPSSVAYAVGFDGSLWRSSDGGMSWTKIAP